MSVIEKPRRQRGKCCVKTCKKTDIAARGLCHRCYATARYLIRTHKATWGKLESMRLAKPKRSVNASALFDVFFQQSKTRKG